MCGTLLEIAVRNSTLAAGGVSTGVTVHPLSGDIDVHVVELFDSIKVALKRGEVDWTWFPPQIGSLLIVCSPGC